MAKEIKTIAEAMAIVAKAKEAIEFLAAELYLARFDGFDYDDDDDDYPDVDSRRVDSGHGISVGRLLYANEQRILEAIHATALKEDAERDKKLAEAADRAYLASLSPLEYRREMRKRRRTKDPSLESLVRDALFERDLARHARRIRWRTGRAMTGDERRDFIVRGIREGRCFWDRLNAAHVDVVDAFYQLLTERQKQK